MQIEGGAGSLWTTPAGWSLSKLFGDGYRLAGESGCAAGSTTFFPAIEPVVLLLLTIWAVFSLIMAFKTLIRNVH